MFYGYRFTSFVGLSLVFIAMLKTLEFSPFPLFQNIQISNSMVLGLSASALFFALADLFEIGISNLNNRVSSFKREVSRIIRDFCFLLSVFMLIAGPTLNWSVFDENVITEISDFCLIASLGLLIHVNSAKKLEKEVDTLSEAGKIFSELDSMSKMIVEKLDSDDKELEKVKKELERVKEEYNKLKSKQS